MNESNEITIHIEWKGPHQFTEKNFRVGAGKPAAAQATVDLDAILKRLRKLKPTKRRNAANSIKAMFQFEALPINDTAANKILEDLQRRGSLTIDANDRVQFRDGEG